MRKYCPMFSGSKPRTSGESQGSGEAEVRRQRRRRTETRESRHEARTREAETVMGPEVKNRFLAEAEASSLKTASTRTADTVTFVEVEAESSERRAGGSKGESWQKFDKSKWIKLLTRDVTSLCQNVLTFIGESVCQICFYQKWIFTCKFHQLWSTARLKV